METKEEQIHAATQPVLDMHLGAPFPGSVVVVVVVVYDKLTILVWCTCRTCCCCYSWNWKRKIAHKMQFFFVLVT